MPKRPAGLQDTAAGREGQSGVELVLPQISGSAPPRNQRGNASAEQRQRGWLWNRSRPRRYVHCEGAGARLPGRASAEGTRATWVRASLGSGRKVWKDRHRYGVSPGSQSCEVQRAIEANAKRRGSMARPAYAIVVEVDSGSASPNATSKKADDRVEPAARDNDSVCIRAAGRI